MNAASTPYGAGRAGLARRQAEVTPGQAAAAGADLVGDLPQRQAGRALRDLRKIAEGAKNDLREGLGPEFADFDIEDLNPKRFVQKHLLDDLNGDSDPRTPSAQAAQEPARASGTLLAPGERPPFDPDAT